MVLFEFSDLLMCCSLLLLLAARELFVFISGFWFLGGCGVWFDLFTLFVGFGCVGVVVLICLLMLLCWWLRYLIDC